jgi:hypothetical protein
MKNITEAKKIFYDSIGGNQLRKIDLINQDINPDKKDMLEYPDIESVISSRWPVLDDDEGIMLNDLIKYLEKTEYINEIEKEKYLDILNNGDKDLLIVLNENVFFQQEDPEDNLAGIIYEDYQDFVGLLSKIRKDEQNPILNFFKENQDNLLYKDVDKIIEKKVTLEDLYSNVISNYLKDDFLDSFENEINTTEEILKIVEIIEDRKIKVFEKLLENDFNQNQFNKRIETDFNILDRDLINLEEPLTQEKWDNNKKLKEKLIYFKILLNNSKKELKEIYDLDDLILNNNDNINSKEFYEKLDKISFFDLNPKIKETFKEFLEEEKIEELSNLIGAQADILNNRVNNLEININGNEKIEGLEKIIKNKTNSEDFKIYNNYEEMLKLDTFDSSKEIISENKLKLKSISDLDIVEKIKEDAYKNSKLIDYGRDDLNSDEVKKVENVEIYKELEDLRITLKNLKGLTFEEYKFKTPKSEQLSEEDFNRELKDTITQNDFDLNKKHIILLDEDGNPKISNDSSKEIIRINPVELQRKIAYFEILKKETKNDKDKILKILKNLDDIQKDENLPLKEKNEKIREALKIFNLLSKNSMTDSFKNEIQNSFTNTDIPNLIKKLELKKDVLMQREEILDIKLNGGIGKGKEGINTLLHKKSRTQEPLKLTRFDDLIKNSETFNEEELLSDIETEFNKFREKMNEMDQDLRQRLEMAGKEELNLLELIFPLKSMKQALILLEYSSFLTLRASKNLSEYVAVKKVKKDLKEFSDKVRKLNKIELEDLKEKGSNILNELNGFEDKNISKKTDKIINQSADFISNNLNLVDKVDNILSKISKNEIENSILNKKFIDNDENFNVDDHFEIYKKNKEVLTEIQTLYLKEIDELKNNSNLSEIEKENGIKSLSSEFEEKNKNILNVLRTIEKKYDLPETNTEVNFDNLVKQAINEDILSKLREAKTNGLESLIITDNPEYDSLLKAYTIIINNEKNIDDDLEKDSEAINKIEKELNKINDIEDIKLLNGTNISISPYKKQIINKLNKIKANVKRLRNERKLYYEKNNIIKGEMRNEQKDFEM